MCHKNLRLFFVLLLIVLLSTGGCVQDQNMQNGSSSATESEEVEMDPSIERDAQMIVETLSLPEYYEENALWSVRSLRDLGVGSFVSLRIVDDANLNVHESDRMDYLVEIVDDSGTTYYVDFNDDCLVFVFFPPDGSREKIIYNQEIP